MMEGGGSGNPLEGSCTLKGGKGKGKTGKTGTLKSVKYVITDYAREYTSEGLNLKYYEGTLSGDHVCFVVVSNRKVARDICRLSKRATNPNVLQAILYFRDDRLKETLVCFDRFRSCLAENVMNKYMASMSAKVPGCLGDPTRTIIKLLTGAIIYLHSKGLSSSWLGSLIGFVEVGNTIKILMVDVEILGGTKSWEKRVRRDTCSWGDVVKNFFAVSAVEWDEKVSFLTCFLIPGVKNEDRLKMIEDHPFLHEDTRSSLRFLAQIQCELVGSSVSYKNRELYKVYEACKPSNKFSSQILDTSGSWKKNWNDPDDDLISEAYSEGSYGNGIGMDNLLKFIRNMYQHQHERGISMDYLYRKVKANWPDLINGIFEYSWGGNRFNFKQDPHLGQP